MMAFIVLWHRTILRLLAVSALSLGLAACSTTGNSFDSSALRFIVVGETTLEEASSLLEAEPTDIYRQQDGSAMARWSHKSSLLTDAIYLNQELWLSFGSDGYFKKVVKSVNLPLASTHTNSTVSASPVSTSAVAPPSYQAVAAPASTQADPAPDNAIDGVIYRPAVSYPLPQ